jgi:Holliday junction resolvase RusA-like endonuclease
MIRFTLPYPPPMNHLHAVVRGRKILSAKGRKYKEAAAKIVSLFVKEPMSGPLHVTLMIYRPRKCGDLDNLFKAPFDSVKGIAWGDDAQVKKLTATLYDDKHNPRLEMIIEAMEPTVTRLGGPVAFPEPAGEAGAGRRPAKPAGN